MRRHQLYQGFVGFLVLSILSVILFRTAFGSVIKGIVEQVTAPIQRVAYAAKVDITGKKDTSEVARLKEEIIKLRQQLVDQKDVLRDNEAFHDQFATTNLSPKQLLPIAIIGMEPTTFVIDAGTDDHVSEGAAVVYKNTLLGQVTHASSHRSTVSTIQSKQLAFSIRTTKTKALGIVRGQDGGILLDKVVLSDKLEVGDTVETKGDMNEDGTGYPPGLLVGKIIAVHKTPSSLFQAAEIAPLVDITQLTRVFAIIH